MVTAEPPAGGALAVGSVTISTSVKATAASVAAGRPTSARPPGQTTALSSGRLDDHGRSDPIGLGGLVDGQQLVAVRRPGPTARRPPPRGAPGRAAAPGRPASATSVRTTDLVEVAHGLGRGEHHGRGQLVDQPGVVHGERPDPGPAQVAQVGTPTERRRRDRPPAPGRRCPTSTPPRCGTRRASCRACTSKR